MRLFDVLGPVMIGPSSSHTAGAAKIGYTAQKLLGEVPAQADIGLYGSFATTGKGHGTDRALVAGLLGLPCLFLLPHIFSDPLEGVWYSMPVSDAAATILSAWLLVREVKKLKKIQADVHESGHTEKTSSDSLL